MAQSNNGIARDCNPRLSAVSDLPASSGAAPPPDNDNHIHNHRTSPLPDTYAALTSAIASFLAVSIHQILYLRAVYPQPTFLPVRHFNHPVRQSRHPKVCSWVTDACAAVEAQLLKCSVAAVSVVILSARTNRPLERYPFDMNQIPEVPAGDIHTPFERSSATTTSTSTQPQEQPSMTGSQPHPIPIDLEAQFRAVLARLASACARLTPLPATKNTPRPSTSSCATTLTALPASPREEQLWIAAEPYGEVDLNSSTSNNNNNNKITNGCSNHPDHSPANDDSFDNNMTSKNGSGGGDGGGVGGKMDGKRGSRGRAKTVPVRKVDAGEMKLEVWIEEAKGKFEELDRIRAEHPP
ncbi:mitotic spindle checkpoint protein (Mad2B) [Histoplasma capsulatum]|uniref:Mitotic spindle checkpoint protein (Mad2B) n=1 Tax=Ajellomyces capsulatus TaxID=5037 RepID=A0A8H8CRB5_AJECA|nr:mitotic spindle checkpoint protein (Mad2B) [Histoplasma capsulatum]